MTDDVTQLLRDACDRRVEERAMPPPPVWETVERDRCLTWLQRERSTATLLETRGGNRVRRGVLQSSRIRCRVRRSVRASRG
jgi:hypothetical protein